jgi:hypothetical protein
LPVWLKLTVTVPPESVIRPSSTRTCAGQAELLAVADFSLLLLRELVVEPLLLALADPLALAVAELLVEVFADPAEVSALAPWAPAVTSTAAAANDAVPNTSR